MNSPLRSTLVAACALAAATRPGAAQVAPLQDNGITPTTALPDPDLVVARERAYGASGVDLSAYGIGGGTQDFVQSIYFRFFVDNAPGSTDSFSGRIVFPPEITILGVITDGTQLGGSADDGVWSASDALFGVGGNPDAYSESARGFECCGSAGRAEFVCVSSPQTLVFGLNIQDGVDDFRVIIDYGTSFPPDLTFDIGSYALASLGGAVPSRGLLIGDVSAPVVLGSGDHGEIGSLLGIPLTATTAPTVGCNIPLAPESNVFVLRDTSGDTFVDGFDVDLLLPGPEQFRFSSAVLSTPRCLLAGPDALLYAFGGDGGYGILDPRGNVVDGALIADLPGSLVDGVWSGGGRQIVVVRDTSGDTHVDVFDVDSRAFVADLPIPATVIGGPVGVAHGANGLLYVLGQTTGFASLDPQTGAVLSIGVAPPSGTYVDITGRAGSTLLYLARDTTGPTEIDTYDVATGQFVHAFATTSAVATPRGLCVGPGGDLYLVGAAMGGATGLVEFDPDSGAEGFANTCMSFSGSGVDIAYTLPGPIGVYCTAKTNSLGCIPAIASVGNASASSALPFFITCTAVLNNKSGVFFYGLGPNSAPFQGGVLCVQTPIRRTPIQVSSGNPPPDDCSGAFAFEFNARIRSGVDPALVPCTTIYGQYWYRDPASPSTTGLSAGLSFEVGL